MTSSIQALQQAARETFASQHEDWRKILTGLDEQALNWKPGEDTNSITILVSHSMDAERFLMASAVGVELDRDRESKFQTIASGPDELLELVNQTETEVNGYIDQLTDELLSADHARPGRTHTGAWWLLHAIEHSREHVGQAFLSRQMYEQR